MAEPGDLLPALYALTEAAEAVWPTFRLDRATFRQQLLARADVSERPEALYKIHVADLYLCQACALGISDPPSRARSGAGSATWRA
jgi:hypothetical protein